MLETCCATCYDGATVENVNGTLPCLSMLPNSHTCLSKTCRVAGATGHLQKRSNGGRAPGLGASGLLRQQALLHL